MREMIKAIQSKEDRDNEAFNNLGKVVKDAGVVFATTRDCNKELGVFIASVAMREMMTDIFNGYLYEKITPEESLDAYLTLTFIRYEKEANL